MHSGMIRVVLILFGVFLLLTGMDLVRQPGWPELGDLAQDSVEHLLLLGAMAATAWAVFSIRDLRDDQNALRTDVTQTLVRGEAWRASRQNEIAAMGRAIADQFRVWGLTEAEMDVAGLMLKGAALKEIARARETSEATIRQQAQGVYRKSGLSGRAELSAYFLESLFETAEDLVAGRPRLVAASGETIRPVG